MPIIKTKSFKLAAAIKGNKKSNGVVILLPGRLDTKDYINFESHLNYLSNKGYLAVAIDPPGTWESPGDIRLFTTTNYIKAVNELIEHFGNKPTLLIGHSRGGAVSIFVAKENPYVIGCVIIMPNLGSPTPPDPESIKKGYKVSYRDLPPGSNKTKDQKVFNQPMDYFTDGEKYDPASAIKQLKKPKMVLYGDRDEFLTPKEVEQICKDIPQPKILKELHSTHDYRYCPEVIGEVNSLLGKFVDTYFPINN